MRRSTSSTESSSRRRTRPSAPSVIGPALPRGRLDRFSTTSKVWIDVSLPTAPARTAARQCGRTPRSAPAGLPFPGRCSRCRWNRAWLASHTAGYGKPVEAVRQFGGAAPRPAATLPTLAWPSACAVLCRTGARRYGPSGRRGRGPRGPCRRMTWSATERVSYAVSPLRSPPLAVQGHGPYPGR